jgi:beta-glucosidase
MWTAYTNYTYSNIQITSTAKSGPASGDIAPGGREDLFDNVATVTCTITNSGPVTGSEVAQLYITLPSGSPASPPKQLRGFVKLPLAAGSSGNATFDLRQKDLSYWDAKIQNWIVPSGSFGVSIGASSRDVRLTGTLQVS